MKKMRNGKRGFTLLEIITVVAIIVIIAGAAVVGVTVTLQRASATKAYLEDNNGRNFESEARNTIKHLTVNTVDWSPIPKYTPQNLAQEKWDEMLEFGWTVEELGGELKYRDSGWYIEALEGDPSAAWDPTLHNNLTLDQYTEMKSQVSSYLKAGYTMEELGLTYGGPDGYSLNPQWNPGLHNGKPVPGTVITPDPTEGSTTTTTTTTTESSETSKEIETPVNVTPDKPDDTGGQQGGGAVSFSGTTHQSGNGVGNAVSKIKQNDDGSTTIGLVYSDWQVGTVQIWKNPNGTYDIQGVDGRIGDVIGNAVSSTGASPNWSCLNSNTKYTLSPSEVAAIEKVYGIKFK